MLGPGIVEGARAPIFDRLVDESPKVETEPRPFRTLNRQELRESVRRDLGRLLNTRCPIPPHLLYGRQRSVVDYGAPDFTTFTPQNAQDQTRLGFLLTRTVEAFEPRLHRVRVSISPNHKREQALRATLEAVLVVGSIAEAVSFPIAIQRKTGEVEVFDG